MPRLTSFLLRHKLAVVAAWLVVLVAGGAAAGVVPSRLSQEFSFPGEEGYEANVAILEAYQDPAIQRWNLRRFGSLAEAGAWIAQWDRQWQAERDGCWAVADGDGTVHARVAGDR